MADRSNRGRFRPRLAKDCGAYLRQSLGKGGLFLTFLTSLLTGAEPPPASPLDLLSGDNSSAVGKLFFKRGALIEPIELGPSEGRYGFAFLFKASLLAHPPTELKDKLLIQIKLGTNRAKIQKNLPQFGEVSLIVPNLPFQELHRVDFRRLDGKQTLPNDYAIMKFHSPKLPAEASEEEKLKSTYFSEGGNIALVPLGSPSLMTMADRGLRLRFRTQRVHVDFHARLVTPFNPQGAELNGGMEIPFYTPYGKESEFFVKKISEQSTPPLMALDQSPSLSDHRRELAGSPKDQKADPR